MSVYSRPASREDYRIAVICALRSESDAVEAMFDDDWDAGPKLEPNSNTYSTGRIGEHNVVLAFMPGIGKANSAKLTGLLHFSYPQIRLGLVVGICGGMPFFREFIHEPEETDVFLGDVIISTAVVQYDFGHRYSDKLVPMDTLQNTLGRPNDEIRGFLRKMQGLKGRKGLEDKTRGYLASMVQKQEFEKFRYQGVDKDILYKSTYRHKHHESTDCVCAKCENIEDEVCEKALFSTCEELKCYSEKQVCRTRLEKAGNDATIQTTASNRGAQAPSPRVHFGVVASGDSVVKSAYHRDELANSKEAIGFEMEGAGAWEGIPIVVIKGVVDYADSHKSYLWQKYGAACGAACMKAFLDEWKRTEKILQSGAGSSAHGPLKQQTGESSGVTREESETQSRLANLSKDVDRAYILLDRRNKDSMRGDLETALRILLQAEVESKDVDFSFRRRIYWGLMAVEKELSCYREFEKAEKLEHINKAQKYNTEVKTMVSQSPDASLHTQLSLEQHIIEGRKASLDFEIDRDVDKLKRLKSEAIDGIDASLKKLREVDMESYDKVSRGAMKWRKVFIS